MTHDGVRSPTDSNVTGFLKEEPVLPKSFRNGADCYGIWKSDWLLTIA